jgi:lipopolysaccharide export system protein LptC
VTSPRPADERLDRLVRQPRSRTRGGSRYSSLVRSLRVLLPLSAGALLLLAIIWPQLEFENALDVGGLPQSIDDINSAEIRMIAARVVGTDEEGRPFTLRAEEAQQLDGVLNRVVLRKPQAEIQVEDGETIQVSADEGEYSREDESMVFRRNVVLIHSLGYRIETELANVDIPAARAYGDQPVSGTGPNGTLSGSGFEILDKGKTVKVLGRSKLILNEIPEKKP